MESPSNQTPALSPAAPLRVLYVNDSTDDQLLFQDAASRAGVPLQFHVVDSVASGISYLKDLLDQNHQPLLVDLVLLDLVMPDDSGLAVLKYIRETPRLSTLPVVILTGQMNPATQKQAYDMGANAFHEKPVSFEDSVLLASTLYSHWSTAKRPTH